MLRPRLGPQRKTERQNGHRLSVTDTDGNGIVLAKLLLREPGYEIESFGPGFVGIRQLDALLVVGPGLVTVSQPYRMSKWKRGTVGPSVGAGAHAAPAHRCVGSSPTVSPNARRAGFVQSPRLGPAAARSARRVSSAAHDAASPPGRSAPALPGAPGRAALGGRPVHGQDMHQKHISRLYLVCQIS